MKNNNAFTLIELLIVVALIMILSAVGLGSYSLATVKSYDTQRKNDLSQLSKSLEAFNADVGRYPLSDELGNVLCYQSESSVITNPSCALSGSKLTSRVNGITNTYITIPTDPDTSNKYYYVSDGSSYSYYTVIQNDNDRDLLRDVNGDVISDPYGVMCGSSSCNYKISEIGLSKTNE